LKGVTLDDDYWLPAITQIQMLWRDSEEWNSFRRNNRPAILDSADFSGAEMGNADLSNVTLTTSNFDGACLRGCNLTDTSFIGASLIKADCTGLHTALTNFEGAVLNEACFARAELRSVRMKKAIAAGTSFTQALLLNCDLSEITAIEADFDRAELEGVIFFNSHLNQTSFRDAKLTQCNFRKASLTDCNFEGTEKKSCIIDGDR
jgi:uncharacterized protein YjbI with pentapeptide repeats